MFWKEKEDVKYCKDCKHYQIKDWSVNYECKLGEKTPNSGNTVACKRFKQK